MKIETVIDVLNTFLLEAEVAEKENNPDFQKEVIEPLRNAFESIKEWRT